jgi:hypothetical protein
VDPKLVAYCQSQMSNGSIGQELDRLAALVRCERGDKDAIKAWSASMDAKAAAAAKK